MIIDDILNVLNVDQPGLVLKIIAALVIVLLSIVIGRLLGKLVHKVLHELELDIILSRHFEFGLPAERWGSSLISFLIDIMSPLLQQRCLELLYLQL